MDIVYGNFNLKMKRKEFSLYSLVLMLGFVSLAMSQAEQSDPQIHSKCPYAKDKYKCGLDENITLLSCVGQAQLCDKTKDCPGRDDRSDEEEAHLCKPETTPCEVGRHSCKTNSSRHLCLPKNFLCDGIYDCQDKSDEDREDCKIDVVSVNYKTQDDSPTWLPEIGGKVFIKCEFLHCGMDVDLVYHNGGEAMIIAYADCDKRAGVELTITNSTPPMGKYSCQHHDYSYHIISDRRKSFWHYEYRACTIVERASDANCTDFCIITSSYTKICDKAAAACLVYNAETNSQRYACLADGNRARSNWPISEQVCENATGNGDVQQLGECTTTGGWLLNQNLKKIAATPSFTLQYKLGGVWTNITIGSVLEFGTLEAKQILIKCDNLKSSSIECNVTSSKGVTKQQAKCGDPEISLTKELLSEPDVVAVDCSVLGSSESIVVNQAQVNDYRALIRFFLIPKPYELKCSASGNSFNCKLNPPVNASHFDVKIGVKCEAADEKPLASDANIDCAKHVAIADMTYKHGPASSKQVMVKLPPVHSEQLLLQTGTSGTEKNRPIDSGLMIVLLMVIISEYFED